MIREENLSDKNIRRRLIERYLDAQTDPEEERILAEYFRENVPDDDEKAVALLLGISAADPASDEGAEEFDRIVSRRRRVRFVPALIAACAAVVVMVVLPLAWNRDSGTGADLSESRDSFPETDAPVATYVSSTAAKGGISPAEIASCLDQVLTLCGDAAVSADARPSGTSALVTVNMKDGSSRKYFMTFGCDGGSASLVALAE